MEPLVCTKHYAKPQMQMGLDFTIHLSEGAPWEFQAIYKVFSEKKNTFYCHMEGKLFFKSLKEIKNKKETFFEK